MVVSALPDCNPKQTVTSSLSSRSTKRKQQKHKQKHNGRHRHTQKSILLTRQNQRQQQQQQQQHADGTKKPDGSTNTISNNINSNINRITTVNNKNSNSSINNENRNNSNIEIVFFLTRRRFPIRKLMRTVCLLFTAWSFLQCLRTSGIPYAQTVHQIVYGSSSDSVAIANSAVTSLYEYVPSAMDRRLAQMILSCKDDFNTMLPPATMPSVGPLSALIASIASYATFDWLLPVWSTRFRVLLEYKKTREFVQDVIDNGCDDSNGSDSNDNVTGTCGVLVRLGGSSTGTRTGSDGAKSKTKNLLVVLPLQFSRSRSESRPIQVSSKKKSKSAEKSKSRSSYSLIDVDMSSEKSMSTEESKSQLQTNNSKKRKKTKQKQKPLSSRKLSSSSSSSPHNNNNNNLSSSANDDNDIIANCVQHLSDYYFEMDDQHTRIYCDVETKECTEGAPTLHEAPLKDLQALIQRTGRTTSTTTATTMGLTPHQRKLAKERYQPYNTFRLTTSMTPTLRKALAERLSSPLVVIQLIGKLVALLEEGTGATIVSLGTTLGQHVFYAHRAIAASKQLAEEVETNLQTDSDCLVSVLRTRRVRAFNNSNDDDYHHERIWVSAKAGDLLPGDIFRLAMETSIENNSNSSSNNNTAEVKNEWIVPVDALVLRGQCLTNEAILTGESVPQIKIPLDLEEEQKVAAAEATTTTTNDNSDVVPPRRLDLHKDRSSILFAGTTLFHTLGGVGVGVGGSDPFVENNNGNNASSGVTCLALRTGTYSSKGNLLKAIKGRAHLGAISNEQSEQDAVRMIGSLSVCAFLSCVSLFFPNSNVSGGGADGGTNKIVARVSPFRRVVQCTRILLASIPSNLPLALAAIARSCSGVLRHQADVVCSEPGSLLTAAYIDTVVFDKVCTHVRDEAKGTAMELNGMKYGVMECSFFRGMDRWIDSLVRN